MILITADFETGAADFYLEPHDSKELAEKLDWMLTIKTRHKFLSKAAEAFQPRNQLLYQIRQKT